MCLLRRPRDAAEPRLLVYLLRHGENDTPLALVGGDLIVLNMLVG